MQNHEQKKKVKKSENPRFYGQKQTFFLVPCPSAIGQFQPHGCMFSENTRRMNLIPVFNKNSPRAHTESELSMLGVHGKLAKYVVHLSKRKN
jgi:hypothetical protein